MERSYAYDGVNWGVSSDDGSFSERVLHRVCLYVLLYCEIQFHRRTF